MPGEGQGKNREEGSSVGRRLPSHLLFILSPGLEWKKQPSQGLPTPLLRPARSLTPPTFGQHYKGLGVGARRL